MVMPRCVLCFKVCTENRRSPFTLANSAQRLVNAACRVDKSFNPAQCCCKSDPCHSQSHAVALTIPKTAF